MTTALDPVTTQIIRNALAAAAHEMNTTLVRTAFNPLLFDVRDFGISITSASGDLWAEDPGLTVFLACCPDTVRGGIGKHGADGFQPGDVLIASDPYATGTHVSDTSVYMPVFSDDELVAFVIITAHWADIGGRTPGGWDVSSTEIYQEGLLFTHQKLYIAGEPTEFLGFIRDNVRFPDMVTGDLNAQIAACRQGVSRITALCRKYGSDVIAASMADVIDRTREAMRREIEALPDGVYADEVDLDHDGVEMDTQHTVKVQLHVEGDRITARFDGTSPTATGPINCPAMATRSAIRTAIKGLFFPHDTANEGHLDAIDFDVPDGLLVSPVRPAPTDSFGYVFEALMELTIAAMARALPDRARAGAYQVTGVYFFRTDARTGVPFIMIDPVDGGHGGFAYSDGATMIFTADGDTPNLPAEVLETRYPVRCTQFAFDPASGGAGARRGGLGVSREYELLGEGIASKTALENTKSPLARGVNGGGHGRPSQIIVWPDTDRQTVMNDRAGLIGPFRTGERLRLLSGGGGGFGDPRDRDVPLVVDDVYNDLVSVDEARDIYGVVLDWSNENSPPVADQEATARLRQRSNA